MQRSILIAGVGNIFHGDDAFGSEVARRLAQTALPPEVRVVDFGIRGQDLAFALQEDYDAVILVDVAQRSRPPGTLSVIEPDLSRLDDETNEGGIDAHAMHPLRILRFLQIQGNRVPPLWLVACEPLTFGPDEGQIGLSEPVAAAIAGAVALVQSLLQRMVLHENE
jgi:hydrogenase maturation protease